MGDDVFEAWATCAQQSLLNNASYNAFVVLFLYRRYSIFLYYQLTDFSPLAYSCIILNISDDSKESYLEEWATDTYLEEFENLNGEKNKVGWLADG